MRRLVGVGCREPRCAAARCKKQLAVLAPKKTSNVEWACPTGRSGPRCEAGAGRGADARGMRAEAEAGPNLATLDASLNSTSLHGIRLSLGVAILRKHWLAGNRTICEAWLP